MKFENVKVRISTQVINIGQPERWNVIETTVLLEGDTICCAIAQLLGKKTAPNTRVNPKILGDLNVRKRLLCCILCLSIILPDQRLTKTSFIHHESTACRR